MNLPKYCRHCNRMKQYKIQLCWSCYYTQGIRSMYDPEAVVNQHTPEPWDEITPTKSFCQFCLKTLESHTKPCPGEEGEKPIDRLNRALDELWAEAVDEEIDGSGKVNHYIDTDLYLLCESIKNSIIQYEQTKKEKTNNAKTR